MVGVFEGDVFVKSEFDFPSIKADAEVFGYGLNDFWRYFVFWPTCWCYGIGATLRKEGCQQQREAIKQIFQFPNHGAKLVIFCCNSRKSNIFATEKQLQYGYAEYKGFIGSIEAELDSNTLYGKVLGLDKGTLVTYEGNTLAELREDFINAVEDYIAFCKEKGLPLHKSYTGSFNIRIPIELHAKAAAKAQEEGISLNAFVKESLMQAVV